MCRTQANPADAAALEELLKDIPLVPLWDRQLGDNLNRRDVAPNNVVLLVRGELFSRYPNAIVYAVKAKQDRKGKRIRDDVDSYPIFRAPAGRHHFFWDSIWASPMLAAYNGFSRRNSSSSFQQPPAEPRFGSNRWEHRFYYALGGTVLAKFCQYSGRHRPQGSLDGRQTSRNWLVAALGAIHLKCSPWCNRM